MFPDTIYSISHMALILIIPQHSIILSKNVIYKLIVRCHCLFFVFVYCFQRDIYDYYYYHCSLRGCVVRTGVLGGQYRFTRRQWQGVKDDCVGAGEVAGAFGSAHFSFRLHSPFQITSAALVVGRNKLAMFINE